MFTLVMSLVVMGIIAGHLARLFIPGRDPLTFLQTTVLGIVGSFVGGTLGYWWFDVDTDDGVFQPAGVVGSVLGSMVTLVVFNIATDRMSNRF